MPPAGLSAVYLLVDDTDIGMSEIILLHPQH
jgi:hypothetical protein